MEVASADAASIPPGPKVKLHPQMCLEYCLKKVTAYLEICKALQSSKDEKKRLPEICQMTSGSRAPFKLAQALQPLILARSGPVTRARQSASGTTGPGEQSGGALLWGVMVKVKSRLFHRLFCAKSPRCGPNNLQLTVRLEEVSPEG